MSMSNKKRVSKKGGALSTLLELLDMADATIETVTGKGIASWFKTFQEQGRIEQPTQLPPPQVSPNDPYIVLGLPHDASVDDIKQRYRALAMIFHPDRKGGNTEAMKRLNHAFREIMSTKEGKA